MLRTPGSKQLILEFFLKNIGVILESKDIKKRVEEQSNGQEEYAS